MFFIDYLYIIIVLPFVFLALWAQWNVNSTFKRYSRVETYSGMSGAEAARLVLDRHGLHNVRVEEVGGHLTDHFDPRTNVIRLSGAVYHGRSAASVGVAAHEAGHAVQYAEEYGAMKLRAAIIPATNIGSNLAFPLILVGLLLSYPPIAYLGVIAFSLSVVFQLVTLPVEFNASRRALTVIGECGRFSPQDRQNAGRVLRAAALTYVAALAVALANLLRLVIIVSGSSRRNS